ncbi:MAG: hypothetical protein HOH14_10225 [Gammaproteobacteria bacterium]|jgi:hypothetical protein|nr:hypothetical protein [Gammaproteobacteria bacterium]
MATTIQKLSFESLVSLSELIIEGEVISVKPFASGELIYTRVLLKVDDVLKGEEPGEFLELDFVGGFQDGISVSVAGQDIPVSGERGFYFIEDRSIKAVNPLTGWSQGHFRIVADIKGNEFLATQLHRDGQNIVELGDNKNSILAVKLRNMKFSNKLVEQAYYSPSTPEELRDAVYEYLDTMSGD